MGTSSPQTCKPNKTVTVLEFHFKALHVRNTWKIRLFILLPLSEFCTHTNYFLLRESLLVFELPPVLLQLFSLSICNTELKNIQGIDTRDYTLLLETHFKNFMEKNKLANETWRGNLPPTCKTDCKVCPTEKLNWHYGEILRELEKKLQMPVI